jgi:hypothetical protein
MTTARCPLVREIEEDIATNGESFRGSILRERYDRLRAALEAAEEMAGDLEFIGEDFGYDLESVERYRAATRGS